MIQISDTIILRPVSLDDASGLFNILNMERAHLRQWLPFVDTTMKESDTFAYIQWVIEHNGIQYSIFENEKLVGLIGFKYIDTDNLKTEIGYWLSEYAEGKGIMVNSAKALLSMAFFEFELNRVQISVAVDNKKSRAIPEKLGFTLEGIERDGELLVENKFTDIAIYGLLKKDFKP